MLGGDQVDDVDGGDRVVDENRPSPRPERGRDLVAARARRRAGRRPRRWWRRRRRRSTPRAPPTLPDRARPGRGDRRPRTRPAPFRRRPPRPRTVRRRTRSPRRPRPPAWPARRTHCPARRSRRPVGSSPCRTPGPRSPARRRPGRPRRPRRGPPPRAWPRGYGRRRRGGTQSASSPTPATCAGIAVIRTVDGYAARPPGTYKPGAVDGDGELLRRDAVVFDRGRRCGRAWCSWYSRMRLLANSSPSRNAVGAASSAVRSSSRGTRAGRRGDNRRIVPVKSRSAASPPSRTAATMARTASTGPVVGRGSARARRRDRHGRGDRVGRARCGHRNREPFRGLPELPEGTAADEAGSMSLSSDFAELSSLRAQLEELTGRVVAVGDRYRDTDDSAVAGELDQAERALLGARALHSTAPSACSTGSTRSSRLPDSGQSRLPDSGQSRLPGSVGLGRRADVDEHAARAVGLTGEARPGARAGSAAARTAPAPPAGPAR